MSQIQPFSEITEAQFQAWVNEHKAENRVVKAIAIPLEDGVSQAKFVIVQPSRMQVRVLGDFVAKKNIDGGNEFLLKNCVLGGDIEFIEKDDDIYFALMEELGALIAKKKAHSISFSNPPSKAKSR